MPDMQPSEILARIPGELMNAHTTGAIHAVINRAEKAITTHQCRAVIEGKIEELRHVICHKHGFGPDSCPWIKARIKALERELGEG